MPCPPIITIITIIISGHARMNATGRTVASGKPAQTNTTTTTAPTAAVPATCFMDMFMMSLSNVGAEWRHATTIGRGFCISPTAPVKVCSRSGPRPAARLEDALERGTLMP